jgi:flavin reductase (DIM6/NTAB) family NADH-FMN oxidoreductase RutF
VSNLTSVSTTPQQIAVAVYKQWTTYENLATAPGFTLSVPHTDQLDGVWKLGAKYSRYPYADTVVKIAECGLTIDHAASGYGPLLSDGIGWATCRIIERLDFGGDHGLYIGQIEQAHFNPTYLNSDGTPKSEIRPVMQITGNTFTTANNSRSIPYYE